MKHWLFKSEPSDFSLQDLKDAPEQTECWDGVRNYQARNLMRDEMKLGDRALFYHSNLNPSVVGTVTVVRESYPDHTSWDPDCKHFDPKSTPDNPRWFMVDVKFESEFPRPFHCCARTYSTSTRESFNASAFFLMASASASPFNLIASASETASILIAYALPSAVAFAASLFAFAVFTSRCASSF